MNIVIKAVEIYKASSVGSSSSDSASVREGKNSCEGADCLFYDFGFAKSDVGAAPVAHNGCSDTCATPIDDDDLVLGRKGRRA